MTLVVADTTPLRYLVETGYEFLLPQLFSSVVIPGAVADELRQTKTPLIVRQWAEGLPSWVEVQRIERPDLAHEAEGLDRGEWEAIELAKQLDAGLLLMDERTGTRFARALGLIVTGTLGVFVEAARADLISIDAALDQLGKTNFRHSPDLFRQTRELARNLRSSGKP